MGGSQLGGCYACQHTPAGATPYASERIAQLLVRAARQSLVLHLHNAEAQHGSNQLKLWQVALPAAAAAMLSVALHAGVRGGAERGAAVVRLKQACRGTEERGSTDFEKDSR